MIESMANPAHVLRAAPGAEDGETRERSVVSGHSRLRSEWEGGKSE